MDSADFPENSRESRLISQENRPSQETHLPRPTRLDVLALVAAEFLRKQELGLEPGLDDDHDHDFLPKQKENQRGSPRDDESDYSNGDAAEPSAAGEKILSEAASQDELGSYRFMTAKRFAYNLHSDIMHEDAEYHHQDLKKQRIQEDGEKKVDDLGGPFQDAMETIKNKMSNLGPDAARLEFFAGENALNLRTRVAPSLLELCLRQLGKNAGALVSFRCIPDGLRSKIANLVSGLGQVNTHFMNLLVKDSPTEIRVKNCTNLAEKDLTRILHDCDTETLRVLKLDLCGRSMTEHVIADFLSRSPKGFPVLTNLSLKGAFSLTDNALALISRYAPLLQWVNLSYCSLLSDNAIRILAFHFESTLKRLNIEGCQGINPSKVLDDLKRFESLSSLSIAGLEGIDDNLVLGLLEARGSNLTSLVLASCSEVTDDSSKAIGRYCPRLQVLDVSFLDKLTDMSLQYIANGCRSLSTLKCCRNRFSDEGVAAFLEVSGGSLNVLSLNNMPKVSLNTVISLAKVSKKLHSLDLSWCRNLADDDLRVILHSCTSLRQLKLFGCSQLTKELLPEHSGSPVQIIGLSMTPLLKHLNVIEPVFEEASDSE